MTEETVSSIQIMKLGHKLEEIRLRALNNIISKLNYGFVHEKNLVSRRELFTKLLDWFDFEICLEPEKVLKLILRLLKADEEGNLLSQMNVATVTSTLNTIRNVVEPNLHPVIDDILNEMMKPSMQGSAQANDFSETPCLSHNSESGARSIESGARSAESCARTVETAASTVEVHLQELRSVDLQLQPPVSPLDHHHGYFETGPNAPLLPEMQNCFMVLPWQPLVHTDLQVLKAVEESFTTTQDPGLVLYSCQFFTDVMLQDFPAEVFLQRPAIIKLFFEILKGNEPGVNQPLCSAVMKCLAKLTASLRSQVNYYSDPCIANLKQETCTSCSPAPSFLCSRVSSDYFWSCDSQDSLNQAPSPQQPQVAMESEDLVLLRLNQLSLPHYTLLALEHVAPHLGHNPDCPPTQQATWNETFSMAVGLCGLLTVCADPGLWRHDDDIATKGAEQLKHVLVLLADSSEAHRNASGAHRLRYIQLLALCRKLLGIMVPLNLADTVIPRRLKAVLSQSLLDAPLYSLFPDLHSDILGYVKAFRTKHDVEVLGRYKDATEVSQSMKATVKFLKDSNHLGVTEVLAVLDKAIPSLTHHKNLSLVSHCVNMFVSKMHQWTLTEEDAQLCSGIVVKLLAHVDLNVKTEMYACCHKYVLATLGVDHARKSCHAVQLVFLFDCSVLTEIICYGLVNLDKKVQQFAQEMVLHLLKGKFLMTDQMWRRFLESLAPTLPLLECYANKTSVLGRAVSKMLDPDISMSIYLPSFEALKGNLRLLFSSDPLTRDEAVSRLIWMLSRQDESHDRLPNFSTLQGIVLSSVCIIEQPVPLSSPRSPRNFYQVASLVQVVGLLGSSEVEPAVRRSALSQVAVMLEDTSLHVPFLDKDGLTIVLEIFCDALNEKSFNNYPDSVIPVINILRNIVRQNPQVRHTLSQQADVLYCVLRALFLFSGQEKLRHDGAQLLALLLYSDLMLSVPKPTSPQYDVSLPELVVQSVRLPFLCHSHWRTSRHTAPSNRDAMQDELRHGFLRLCWNVAWYGGVDQLLTWKSVLPPSTKEHGEFSQDLCLLEDDLECLGASAVPSSCRQRLFDIQNATTHQAVLESLASLAGYVVLAQLVAGDVDDWWASLPWQETLSRFLTTTPSCPEDEVLLVTVLQFLQLYLKVSAQSERDEGSHEWIPAVLKDGSQRLPNLLKMASETGDRAAVSNKLCRELLQLCQQCTTLNSTGDTSWLNIVHSIVHNLKFSDTQHYYNLAFLESMLSCLAHVTGCLGWSRTSKSAVDMPQLWTDLISCLVELVTAFHRSKGGASLTSFMGLSITRNASFCLNHALCEMQQATRNKGWEAVWVSEQEDLLWLPSLWLSRDPVVRAAGLQLAAGFCTTRRGCNHIHDSFKDVAGGIWEAAINFLVDHGEACLVREQAAILLTNLSSHSVPNSRGGSSLSLCYGPIDTQQVPITGVQAVVLLLDEHNFYGEVTVLVSRLYIGTTVAPDGVVLQAKQPPNMPASLNEPSTSRSDNAGSIGMQGSVEPEPHVVTTPSLLKAVCCLLVNLLTLSPHEMLLNINKFDLVTTIFSCLGDILQMVSTTVDTSLYVDVLEMYTAVCSLLAKLVAVDAESHSTLLRSPAPVHTLLALLNPVHYHMLNPHLLLLRDCLWGSVFSLLSALLPNDQERGAEGYGAVCSTLSQCGHEQFMSAVKLSVEGSTPHLRDCALNCLTSLLALETRTRQCPTELQSVSMQSMLDGYPDTVTTTTEEETPCTVDGSGHGSDLCKSLLRLYEMHTLQRRSAGKGAVVAAMTSLLGVSHEAKQLALEQGLLEMVVVQLRELHVRLSMESVDAMRRAADKKRVAPLLNELVDLFHLLTNFLLEGFHVKTASAKIGLADLIHKLWVWCNVLPSLMTATMQLLCTFTSSCPSASQSLVLTTTVPGVGLRKVPSSLSLLHVLVAKVLGELELVGRNHDLHILGLTFHLLRNSCQAAECRTTIAKGNLLQSLTKLHPSLTKKLCYWEPVEVMWLEFLGDFTFHPEGQLAVPKVTDALDILILMTKSNKTRIKMLSLSVIRNISFHQFNRPRLLAASEFLQLVAVKLSEGTMEEKGVVATMVWALVANNQKAKLVMKCSGIDSRLQEALHQVSLLGGGDSAADERVRILSYVLQVLRADNVKSRR